MTSIANVTENLCQWLSSVKAEDLPAAVYHKAIDTLLDSVGAMLACSTLPEVKMIVELAQQQGGREECSIIGNRGRTAMLNAAMANGAMAHGDEVDPVHLLSSGGHVAAGPVPSALVVGQKLVATGKDVLRAVILGYEVGGRLMTLCYRERDYVTRRFYHTAVVGALSSAVTAALLLGADRKTLQVAMGLAVYQAAGPDNMTKDPGHMGKTFQVAAANRNGLTAALLAQKGCFVPMDILDGRSSFFDAYLGNSELAPELLKDLGSYYSITDVMHKRYPVGSPNQTYLQALLYLLKEHRIAAEEIREIEIHLPTRSVHRIPNTRHASISGDMVSAMAAVHGKLDFYQFHDPVTVAQAAVQEMRERVRLVGRDDWQDLEQGRHAAVRLMTTRDQVFEKEVWFQPMVRQEIEDKFEALVAPRVGLPKAHELKRLIYDLPKAPSLEPLMTALEA